MTLPPDRWDGMLFWAAIALSVAGALGALSRARIAPTALAMLGALAGVIASVHALAVGEPVRLIELASGVTDGRSSFVLDALSAVFLVPLFVVAGLGALYAYGYRAGGRRLALSHGLLVVSMALVLTARDGVSFLVVWEVMALSAFVAATDDDRRASVRAAGLVYLFATHTGTLVLIAMVVLLRARTGTFGWTATIASDSTIFVLAVIGFGLKAGLVPLHFWLPGAHANAPSHVSATMSAVMIQTGLYGVLRVTSMSDGNPAWWGVLLLVLGGGSAVLGAALASAQTDIKRVLAYSSVENVGIVGVAIGLALVGRAIGRDELVAIGVAAAVLHVWNHALFKSLLFFGAGAIVHATKERDMDRLGGLAHKMPRTTRLMVLGALAASGLPPLNGFVGEWVLYVGLFRAWTSGVEALPIAFALVALATTGALALAAFVRLIGVALLGNARSSAVEHAHDPAPSMLASMRMVAGLSVLIALATPLLIEWTAPAAAAWTALARRESVATLTALPTAWLTALVSGTVVLVAVSALAIPRRAARAGTWDSGYAAPSARMQYTGRSFGAWIADHFTPRALRVSTTIVAPRGPFPRAASCASDAHDPFLARLYAPAARAFVAALSGARRLQQGSLHLYLLYVLITLVALLVWAALPSSIVSSLWGG